MGKTGQNLQDYQNSILGWIRPHDALRGGSNGDDVQGKSPRADVTFESQDRQRELFEATDPVQHDNASPEGTSQELADLLQMKANLLKQRDELKAMNATLINEVKNLNVSLEQLIEERNALQARETI